MGPAAEPELETRRFEALRLKRVLSIIVLGGLIWCAAVTAASASHYLRLSNNERIHWKSDSSSTTLRTVKVFDNMQNTTSGNRWRSFIGGARTDWDSSSPKAR
jgi:hypothetical protein